MIATAQQCCESCWERRNPGRPAFRRDPVEHEPCLFCGQPTASGIYLRPRPGELQRYARLQAQVAALSERGEAESPATRAEPVRKAGSAPRSESDRGLVRALTGSRPKRHYGQCEFCGAPCHGQACAAHKDLLLAVEGAVA